MDAREKLRRWLEEHGCDGLACGGCSCGTDDLMPCGDPRECLPAVKAVRGDV